MLPAKYRPNRLGDSGEVVWFLPYMGMAAILNFGSKPFKSRKETLRNRLN